MKKKRQKQSVTKTKKRVNRIKSWIKNSVNLIAVITIVLSVISISLTWHEANKETKKLEEQTSQLEKITSTLPTRCIGRFPYFISDINDLLENVISENFSKENNIVIFQDVLTYGLYSNPKEYERLVSNLLKLRSRRYKVSIFVYNDELKDKNRLVQFCNRMSDDVFHMQEEEKCNLLQKELVKDSIYNTFIEYPFGDNDGNILYELRNIRDDLREVPSLTYGKFFEMLDEMENIIHNDVFSTEKYDNFNIIECKVKFNVHCWSNGKNTIFSLPRCYEADEIGFITRDADFLDYIQTMYKDYERINELKNVFNTSFSP